MLKLQRQTESCKGQQSTFPELEVSSAGLPPSGAAREPVHEFKQSTNFGEQTVVSRQPLDDDALTGARNTALFKHGNTPRPAACVGV